MKPLKVTVHLLDGRVNSSDGLFFLDSLLAYVWMEESHPDLLHNNGLNPDNLIIPELPLERKNGRWSASCGFYVQHGEMVEYWHKRLNDKDAATYADFKGRRGKIDASSGDYKNYRIPQTIRLINKIDFYCVGNGVEIMRMITKITNIGKKSAQGYGAVGYWEVTEIEEPEYERGRYGIMRPIPFRGELPDDGQQYQIKKIRQQPPYHLHTERVPCIIPNVRRNHID